MSVELNFWRYKEGANHNDSNIYKIACCDGRILKELEELPIDEILKKISFVFLDWTIQNGNDFEKEGHGVFQIFTTSQIVRFDCYGMQERDMNLIIDILIDFGCPLYDPQIPVRFDSWTDR